MTTPVEFLCWSVWCPRCRVGRVIAALEETHDAVACRGEAAPFAVWHACPGCGALAAELADDLGRHGVAGLSEAPRLAAPTDYVDHYLRAVACCEERREPGDPLRGDLLLALGRACFDAGQHGEAARWLARALPSLEVRGLDDRDLGQAVVYLSGALQAVSDRQAMCGLFERLLAAADRDPDRWQQVASGWHFQLGCAYSSLEDHHRARQQYAAYVACWERADASLPAPSPIAEMARLGLRDYSIALGLEREADALVALEQASEACERYVRALEIWRRASGGWYAEYFRKQLQQKLAAARPSPPSKSREPRSPRSGRLVGPSTIDSSGGCLVFTRAALRLSPTGSGVRVELANAEQHFAGAPNALDVVVPDAVVERFLQRLRALLEDDARVWGSTRDATVELRLAFDDGQLARTVREEDQTPPIAPILEQIAAFVQQVTARAAP